MSDETNETHETPAQMTSPPPSTANGAAPAAEPSAGATVEPRTAAPAAPSAEAKSDAAARPRNTGNGSVDGKNRSTRHNISPSPSKPAETPPEPGHVVHATPSESGAEIKTHADAIAALAELAAVAEAVAPSAAAGLRLRMKVWTSKAGKRYLMPTAVLSDPLSGLMTAYAMSDDDTQIVKLTPIEWNALPFYYFKEDGAAPRASARPADPVR